MVPVLMTHGDSNSFARLVGKTCFVGIGATKAGTNWLADYLSGHPQVCFSPIKELHYFDWRVSSENSGLCRRWHKVFSRRLVKIEQHVPAGEDAGYEIQAALLRKRLEMADRPDAYLEFFDQLIGPEHAAFGEISPSYSVMPASGFAEMKRMLPEPRLIWLLHNPVDRYWSQLRFRMRLNDGFSAEDQFLDKLDDPRYVLRNDHGRTLNHVFSEFNRDEVLVVFYEDLFFGEQRDTEIRQITSFLGIDAQPANFEKWIAPSVKVPLDPLLRQKAVRRFADVYRVIAKNFDSVPESWQEDLRLAETGG